MQAQILIGADIVPTESNYALFENGNRAELIGNELSSAFNEADFTIFNLEAPLTNIATPIVKAGVNLIAPTSTIAGIKAINPNFFTLSNNHIMDQDVEGLHSTMHILQENGIAYAGAGVNLAEAAKPYIVAINGVRVGIYCCAEHEFSIAGEDAPGANPFDPLESFDHVRTLRRKCDRVIVLYHGGHEHYRYPSPMVRRIFRKFATCGADYVVAQHTHCVGCMEDYEGSCLVYGQGNFLFDNADNEFWNTSVLLSIMTDGKKDSLEFIPLVKTGNCVRLPQGKEAQEILSGFRERSEEILRLGAVEEKYKQYARTQLNGYLARFFGPMSQWLPVRILNRLYGRKLYDWYYGRRACLAIENYIECEAHREIVLQGLRIKTE